jgi:hypothetical protein
MPAVLPVGDKGFYSLGPRPLAERQCDLPGHGVPVEFYRKGEVVTPQTRFPKRPSASHFPRWHIRRYGPLQCWVPDT